MTTDYLIQFVPSPILVRARIIIRISIRFEDRSSLPEKHRANVIDVNLVIFENTHTKKIVQRSETEEWDREKRDRRGREGGEKRDRERDRRG